MVVESLLNVNQTKKNPKKAFFIGFLYSILGLSLALWVFPSRSSITSVFFTSMAAIPFITLVLISEEKEDEDHLKKGEKLFIDGHVDVFLVYLYIFLGLVVGFTFLFAVLPQNVVNTAFEDQISTINTIRGNPSTGNVPNTGALLRIVSNNLKVLFFTLLFSFIYGTGAIFILTWNASVISVAIGDLIRLGLNSAGFSAISVIPLSFLRYFVHGIPEIGAYFLGGIAGGILSTALIRSELNKKYFKKIVIDILDLIILAILLLFVAGIIEVMISPYINPLIFVKKV